LSVSLSLLLLEMNSLKKKENKKKERAFSQKEEGGRGGEKNQSQNEPTRMRMKVNRKEVNYAGASERQIKRA
jgi:hypothetical protein